MNFRHSLMRKGSEQSHLYQLFSHQSSNWICNANNFSLLFQNRCTSSTSSLIVGVSMTRNAADTKFCWWNKVGESSLVYSRARNSKRPQDVQRCLWQSSVCACNENLMFYCNSWLLKWLKSQKSLFHTLKHLLSQCKSISRLNCRISCHLFLTLRRGYTWIGVKFEVILKGNCYD